VLAVRQSIWCWAFAASSSALYAWLFMGAGLRMQAALQVFYVAMAAYGWYSWRRGHLADGRAERPSLVVSRWPLAVHALAIPALLTVTVLNVMLLRLAASTSTSAVAVTGLTEYADAAIAWGSVFATFMVARKILENWLYWIVLDLAAAWLYAAQSLFATSALFLVYTLIAVRGYLEWRRSTVARAVPGLADA
jgi:nicotinamide mononucleotide transporter